MTISPRFRLPLHASRSARACALVGLALLVGCASPKVSNRQVYEGGPLPRPGRIIVYDFAATPEDLPSWSQASQSYDTAAPMSEKDLEEGRKLGADVAERLVSKIDAMGIDAVREEGQPPPELNDIVLVGYFTTVDTGSTLKRVVIGFGSGSAAVGVHAEGYHETGDGLELLGSGNVAYGGAGKTPGLIVPTVVTIATANPIGLAVGGAVKAAGVATGQGTAKSASEKIADEIAKILEQRFHEEGWI